MPQVEKGSGGHAGANDSGFLGHRHQTHHPRRKQVVGEHLVKEMKKLTDSSLELAVEGGGTLLDRLARLALVATSREEIYRIISMTIEN